MEQYLVEASSVEPAIVHVKLCDVDIVDEWKHKHVSICNVSLISISIGKQLHFGW